MTGKCIIAIKSSSLACLQFILYCAVLQTFFFTFIIIVFIYLFIFFRIIASAETGRACEVSKQTRRPTTVDGVCVSAPLWCATRLQWLSFLQAARGDCLLTWWLESICPGFSHVVNSLIFSWGICVSTWSVFVQYISPGTRRVTYEELIIIWEYEGVKKIYILLVFWKSTKQGHSVWMCMQEIIDDLGPAARCAACTTWERLRQWMALKCERQKRGDANYSEFRYHKN